MKDATLLHESTSQALRDLLAVLPPEMRLAGLKPEDRLAGLSEAEQVLAFPDAALRALSPEYLATLPEGVQSAIRTRLGR